MSIFHLKLSVLYSTNVFLNLELIFYIKVFSGSKSEMLNKFMSYKNESIYLIVAQSSS